MSAMPLDQNHTLFAGLLSKKVSVGVVCHWDPNYSYDLDS